jgi:hypothetical protein
VVYVFFTNTSATTALHSMNPTHHINNDPSPLSNELNDLIDAHLTTLTQEQVAVFDPSHPHSLLLRVLHEQFTEHLEQQLHSLRQYTTHEQLLIHQFVGNSPPHHPNTTHTNSPNHNRDPDPNPNLNSNQRNTNSPPRRRRYLCYAVRKGRTRGIFHSWDGCRLQVEGIANEFKGFIDLHDAQAYLDPPHASSAQIRMSTAVKIYSLQAQLDVPAQSQIRFPLWLKCLYNITQMELTTVDPLGVFYLVALDADWKLRPQNIMARGAFRPRPTITMLTAYAANASAGTIGAYSIASRNFELQQRVTADLHSAICSSLSSVTLNEINSKHQFGAGSLTPLNLVTELKTMFGTITKQEIDATQALISAPLAHFLDFRDFCSNIHLNYEFLTAAGHAIPELTRIDSFTRSSLTFI